MLEQFTDGISKVQVHVYDLCKFYGHNVEAFQVSGHSWKINTANFKNGKLYITGLEVIDQDSSQSCGLPAIIVRLASLY